MCVYALTLSLKVVYIKHSVVKHSSTRMFEMASHYKFINAPNGLCRDFLGRWLSNPAGSPMICERYEQPADPTQTDGRGPRAPPLVYA